MPLDLRESPALVQELPGLAYALDPQEMLARLQDALFGNRHRYQIAICRPGQATYLYGAGCLLRYELDVTDRARNRTLSPLVTVRMFPTHRACTGYFRDRLAPLAERAYGRVELEPFARPVTILEGLNAALAVFPIDGDLPALVDATDSVRIADVLRRTLPDAARGCFDITRCRVDRGHYGRQHRCVLRYEVEGVAPSGRIECRVFYGKVTSDNRASLAAAAIAAIRKSEKLNWRVRVPVSLGFDPDLQLLLVEALPGAPELSRMIQARVAGDIRAGAWQSPSDDAKGPSPRNRRMALEEAIEEAARVAAALHSSGIELGSQRGVSHEVVALTRELRGLARLSPQLGELLGGWLRRAEDYLQGSDPLPLAFCHGDFSHTQLVFESADCGLVDFDTVGQAEPALDLGHFLAYLRLAVLKARHAAPHVQDDIADELAARFLTAYVAVATDGLEDDAHLRARVAGYEVISLLRLAVHSWRKFKPRRLAQVLTLLEERVP